MLWGGLGNKNRIVIFQNFGRGDYREVYGNLMHIYSQIYIFAISIIKKFG